MIKQTVCPNCGGLLRAESHGWICQKCRGFISLQDGKFYEYVEKPFLPPMTNADRIRSMTDEELAVFLADEVPHGDCYGCELECATYYKDKFDNGCQNAFYRWLKKPVEG